MKALARHCTPSLLMLGDSEFDELKGSSTRMGWITGRNWPLSRREIGGGEWIDGSAMNSLRAVDETWGPDDDDKGRRREGYFASEQRKYVRF